MCKKLFILTEPSSYAINIKKIPPTAVLLREKSVLACYFLLIVRKKMQTYVSMSAFFMTSLRQKISNPKLLRTTKILFLSAEQGEKSHNPDGLWDFLTQLCAKNTFLGRFIPKEYRRIGGIFYYLFIFLQSPRA